jgi:hypothetical protein
VNMVMNFWVACDTQNLSIRPVAAVQTVALLDVRGTDHDGCFLVFLCRPGI